MRKFLFLFIFMIGLLMANMLWAAAPSAPTNVMGAANGPQSVTITWSGTAEGFKVFRSTTSSSNGTQIFITAGKSYTDAGSHLSPQTTYYYRVIAYNSTLESAFSNYTRVTTPAPVVVAPTSVNASANGPQSVTITWSGTAEGFKVFRSTTSSATGSQIYITTGKSYIDAGSHLTPGTTYYYRVIAYKGTIESSFSDYYAITLPLPTITTPTGVNAIANGPQSVTITWNGTAEGFKVFRSTSNASLGSQIYITNGKTYTDSGSHLTPGTTYYYRIIAYTGSVESSFSDYSTVTLSYSAPSAPSNVNAIVNGPQSVTITWSGTAEGFKVFRSTTSSSNGDQIYITNGNNYTDAGVHLTASTTYYYRVIAYNGTVESSFSNYVTATTTENVPVTAKKVSIGSEFEQDIVTNDRAPVISSVTVSSNTVTSGQKITLTCNATDPDGDNIFYYWETTGGKFYGSGNYGAVEWLAPTVAFAVHYKIICLVGDGRGCIAVKEIPIDVMPVNNANATFVEISLLQPKGGEKLVTNQSYLIKWNCPNPNNTIQYVKLEYSADGGTTWNLIEQSYNDGEYNWTPAFNSTHCKVKVSASYRSQVVSEAASGELVVSQTAAVPDAPYIYAIGTMVVMNQLEIGWRTALYADNYTLDFDRTDQFNSSNLQHFTITAPETKKLLTNLANSRYYWRVRANNSGGSSAWSETRTIEVKVNGAPNIPSMLLISVKRLLCNGQAAILMGMMRKMAVLNIILNMELIKII